MGLVTTLKKIGSKDLNLHIVTESELKQIHCLHLQMLNEIASLCEKHKIEWSLCGGSLLGAVRHGGFIPWDDDVDICMTRKNFEKFQNAFLKSEELLKLYELKIPGDKGYILHIARLYLKGPKLIPIVSTGENEGLAVDIFVLENTYDSKLLRFFHGVQCTILKFIGAAAKADACKEMLLKYGESNRKLLHEIKFWLFFAKFFRFRSVEQWWKIADNCFSKVKNDSSKFVVSPRGSRHYFGEIYKREKMCNIVDIPFENIILKAPKDSNYLLTRLYGDNYMKVPAEDEIEQHAFVELDLNCTDLNFQKT